MRHLCICLRGGSGTLAEWALTWTLLASGLIPRVPLVLLGKEWHDLLAVIREGMLSRERDWSYLAVAESIDEALALFQAPPILPAAD